MLAFTTQKTKKIYMLDQLFFTKMSVCMSFYLFVGNWKITQLQPLPCTVSYIYLGLIVLVIRVNHSQSVCGTRCLSKGEIFYEFRVKALVKASFGRGPDLHRRDVGVPLEHQVEVAFGEIRVSMKL